jgi:hypothetical protein
VENVEVLAVVVLIPNAVNLAVKILTKVLIQEVASITTLLKARKTNKSCKSAIWFVSTRWK